MVAEMAMPFHPEGGFKRIDAASAVADAKRKSIASQHRIAKRLKEPVSRREQIMINSL
jgi:hypothetical protein